MPMHVRTRSVTRTAGNHTLSANANTKSPDLTSQVLKSQGKTIQEGRLTCDLCDAPFARRGDFNRHKALHLGLKPYACNDCGKRFSQNSGLKTHLNIHTGAKPHRCNFEGCTRTFADPSSRTRHKRETHVHPHPYRCPYEGCHFKNKRPSLFKTHLEQKHGTSAPDDIESYSITDMFYPKIAPSSRKRKAVEDDPDQDYIPSGRRSAPRAKKQRVKTTTELNTQTRPQVSYLEPWTLTEGPPPAIARPASVMNFSPQPSRPIGKMRITAETPISQRGKKMMNEITLDPFVQWLNVPPEHTSKHFTTFNSADQLGSHNGHHLPESIYIQGPVQGGLRTFLAGITTAHSTSAQSNPPQHFSYSTSPSPAPSGNNYLDTPLSHFTYSANPTLQELSTGTGGSSSSGSNGMLASHQRQPSRSVSPVPFHQYFNPSNLSHNSFSAADLFASHPYEFASGV